MVSISDRKGFGFRDNMRKFTHKAAFVMLMLSACDAIVDAEKSSKELVCFPAGETAAAIGVTFNQGRGGAATQPIGDGNVRIQDYFNSPFTVDLKRIDNGQYYNIFTRVTPFELNNGFKGEIQEMPNGQSCDDTMSNIDHPYRFLITSFGADHQAYQSLAPLKGCCRIQ